VITELQLNQTQNWSQEESSTRFFYYSFTPAESGYYKLVGNVDIDYHPQVEDALPEVVDAMKWMRIDISDQASTFVHQEILTGETKGELEENSFYLEGGKTVMLCLYCNGYYMSGDFAINQCVQS
jgi:hypothetical protein